MSAQDASGVASRTGITNESSKQASADRARPFWPEGWWRLTDIRVGIIPIPIYLLLIVLVAARVYTGEIKSDGPTMIVVRVLDTGGLGGLMTPDSQVLSFGDGNDIKLAGGWRYSTHPANGSTAT